VSVPSGVMGRMLLHSAQPSYPDEAWAKGIQGQVIVRAIIGKDGGISKVEAVSGPDELRAAALHAVSLWRYKPYVLNGQPVEVETKVMVDFHLSGSPLR
jgi:protein TonB